MADKTMISRTVQITQGDPDDPASLDRLIVDRQWSDGTSDHEETVMPMETTERERRKRLRRIKAFRQKSVPITLPDMKTAWNDIVDEMGIG